MGLQELLLHMHPLAAMGLGLIVVLALAFLPRWTGETRISASTFDRRPAGKPPSLGAFLGLDLVPLLVMVDEFWLDIAGMLEGWPLLVSTGLMPLLLTACRAGRHLWAAPPRLQGQPQRDAGGHVYSDDGGVDTADRRRRLLPGAEYGPGTAVLRHESERT